MSQDRWRAENARIWRQIIIQVLIFTMLYFFNWYTALYDLPRCYTIHFPFFGEKELLCTTPSQRILYTLGLWLATLALIWLKQFIPAIFVLVLTTFVSSSSLWMWLYFVFAISFIGSLVWMMETLLSKWCEKSYFFQLVQFIVMTMLNVAVLVILIQKTLHTSLIEQVQCLSHPIFCLKAVTWDAIIRTTM